MSKRLSLIALFTLLFVGSAGQAQWLTRQDLRRATIQAESREARPAKEASKEVSDEAAESAKGGPLGAEQWFWQQRTFGLGYIPQDAVRTALTRVSEMRAAMHGKGDQTMSGPIATEAATAPWKFIGPNNVGGRVNAVAIHPTDPKTVYVGAADGGVWLCAAARHR